MDAREARGVEAPAPGRASLGRLVRERPILRFALAAWLGSLLGADGAGSHAALAAVLVLAATLTVSLAPRGSRALRARRIATYLLICAAAAARAARVEESADPAWTRAWLASRGTPLELGVFERERALGDREAGRVGALGTRLLVAAGSVRDQELVARLGGRLPPAWPRGPEPGPRARIGESSAGSNRSADEGVEPDAAIAPALSAEPAGIEATGELPPLAVSPDEIVRLAARPTPPLALLLASARARLLARTSRIENPLACGLVRALLFGDLALLPEGEGDLFVRTGTFHVLAVSGMQVALVAVWIAWPLGGLLAWSISAASRGRARIDAAILRALLLALFVPLAGAEPPVVRAAITYGLGSLAVLVPHREPFARTGGRRRFATRRLETTCSWALALSLECLAHPRAAVSLSVSLSYAATLGLIHGTGPCVARLRNLLPGAGRISAVGRTGRARPGWIVVPLQLALDSSLSGIAGSFAAVLATMPFSWSRFCEWSPIGIVATPLLLLPIALLLGGGALALCLPPGSLDLLLVPVARATSGLLELCDLVPGSPAPLPPRPLWLVAFAVAASFAMLLARERRLARLSTRAAALAWIALFVPWRPGPRELEVWALDVGSGTAVLLRAPGLGTWIFDAGSRDRPDVAREALAPLLRALEVGDLGIVLSHSDRDHHGALPWIVERFPPRVWAGARPAECEARLDPSILRLDLASGRLELPALVRPGCEGALTLLRACELPGNEGSRSLAIRWGAERLLLSGDAEEEGLAAWLRSDPPERRLRLLTMPHHGSETPWLGALLDHTGPREAWISATRRPRIVRELERRGIRWRSTERDGPLDLELPLPPRRAAEGEEP